MEKTQCKAYIMHKKSLKSNRNVVLYYAVDFYIGGIYGVFDSNYRNPDQDDYYCGICLWWYSIWSILTQEKR